jgi:hypothetical protein
MGAGWQSSLYLTDSNLFNEVYGVNFYKMASLRAGLASRRLRLAELESENLQSESAAGPGLANQRLKQLNPDSLRWRLPAERLRFDANTPVRQNARTSEA